MRSTTAAACHVTAASFKLKYAASAFLVVLIAAAAVVGLFLHAPR